MARNPLKSARSRGAIDLPAPLKPSSKTDEKRHDNACQNCYWKKLGCDRKSPCQRCKERALRCTTKITLRPKRNSRARKLTSEATIQKLYNMILNGESWDFGEPKLDDKGQPDIHDIASKLGRITKGTENFAEFKTQTKPAGLETDTGKKLLGSLPSSPSITHAVRAGSSESDYSANHNNEMLEQQDGASDANIISTRDANTSVPSPTYEDFQTESFLDELWLDLYTLDGLKSGEPSG